MSFRYTCYRWRGGEEWMVRRGPENGPRLLIVPPLFEEMNFTRATLTRLAERLAERGIATGLIDLPGTGESPLSLAEVRWRDWRDAVVSAAETFSRRYILSVRGGALLDDAAEARACFRFAPATGAALLRQMERAQAIGDREAARTPPNSAASLLDLIGYAIPRPLVDALRKAMPADVPALRVLPFTGEGIAPWRRAEPVADEPLAVAVAAEVAGWIATCES